MEIPSHFDIFHRLIMRVGSDQTPGTKSLIALTEMTPVPSMKQNVYIYLFVTYHKQESGACHSCTLEQLLCCIILYCMSKKQRSMLKYITLSVIIQVVVTQRMFQ